MKEQPDPLHGGQPTPETLNHPCGVGREARPSAAVGCRQPSRVRGPVYVTHRVPVDRHCSSCLHLTSQARFQQRQLQEKEQKLLALYEEQSRQGYQRIGPGGGKVRQLFQERRGQNHHPGWDRSHPLDPIGDSRRDRGASLDRNINNVWKQPVRRAQSQARKDNDELQSSRSFEPLDQLVFKYNSPVFGDENEYLSRVNDLDSSRIFRKLPNIGGVPLSDSTDRFKTYIATKQPTVMAPAKEQKPQTRITDVGSISKAMARMSPPSKNVEMKTTVPAPANRTRIGATPPPTAGRQRTTPTPPVGTKIVPRPASDTQASEPLKMNRGLPSSKVTPLRSQPTTSKTPASAIKAPVVRGPPTGGRSDLVPCKICGRNFAPDRIKAHNEICAKTSQKRRKPFDVTKQRVRGTELEAYARKGRASQPPPPLTKSNWRKKHDEFISNIRAAKQAQAHVAKGGKLSDLPPPPPMDTSDLIPCPHCKRKFNDAAAERHIPKCATMLHNKPKPAATASKARPPKRY